MTDNPQTTEWTGKRWRYQTVLRDDGGGRCYTLCECHFDADNRLVAWTERPAMEPSGETPEELRGDLARMLADAYKWEPVNFDTMRTGMTFEHTGVNVERMISALEAAKVVQ
jgi:hypothetical protein